MYLLFSERLVSIRVERHHEWTAVDDVADLKKPILYFVTVILHMTVADEITVGLWTGTRYVPDDREGRRHVAQIANDVCG